MSCSAALRLKLLCDFSLLRRVLPELRSKSLPGGQGCMVVMGQGKHLEQLVVVDRACVHSAGQCRLHLGLGIQASETSCVAEPVPRPCYFVHVGREWITGGLTPTSASYSPCMSHMVTLGGAGA